MIDEIYSKIKSSPKFEVSENSHLCHFFIMPPNSFNSLHHDIDLKDTEVHAGYFNKDSGKIFSFKLFNEDIEKIEEQEVFKKEGELIEEIKLDDVKISLTDALDILNKEIKTNYPNTIPIRTIIVLQKINPFGLVWNITVMRTDFKALNIKIDVDSGELVNSTCESLLDRSMTVNKIKDDIQKKQSEKLKSNPKSCNASNKAVNAFKKALDDHKENNKS